MKRFSNKDRLRQYFVDRGSITRNEASNLHLSARLSERVREFEQEGMVFEHGWVFVDGVRTTDYRYTLVGGVKPKLVSMRTPEGFVVMVHEKRVEEAEKRGLTLV